MGHGVGHETRARRSPSLFDGRTGVRVARDNRDDWAFLDAGGYAQGIGAVSGQRLRVAGLMSGGRLPSQSGRWSALCVADGVVFSGPLTQDLRETEEVRVVGFDPTGETFCSRRRARCICTGCGRRRTKTTGE